MKKNKLVEDHKDISLRHKISETLVPLFEDKLEKLNIEYNNARDEVLKEKFSQLKNQCEKIIVELEEPGPKSGIVTEMSELMADEEFSDKINYDRKYICHNNCVRNLKYKESLPSNIEYFMTRSTRNNYKEYSSFDTIA